MAKGFFAAVLGMMILAGGSLAAQAVRDGAASTTASTGAALQEAALPLRHLALFSSGLGYFEHRGTLEGPREVPLIFPPEAVNDALKSLVIVDPRSPSPAVRYPAADSLFHTLGGLRIDLSGNPGIAEILGSLLGAELEVAAPNLIRGRILAVEYRPLPWDGRTGAFPGNEISLSLYTAGGIQTINLRDIGSFNFTDPAIHADLSRALDLIVEFRNADTRTLRVSLPGEGSRPVVLSYVIPAPVWKAAYRLDLAPAEPAFQGWAIVDNDGDTDWENLELSLVTGRSVSFIQNLYPPYHVSRPVLPLSIAGVAEGRAYESGSGALAKTAEDAAVLGYRTEEAPAPRPAARNGVMQESAMAEPQYSRAGAALTGGAALATPQGSDAGDQFEFTFRDPVSLARGQSAMLPLAAGTMRAEKTLVFSGERAVGRSIHPAIGAELTNTTGMKLPAGPITVYDGGVYAGDALIEFFPEGEKRLISYGEDLSVSGTAVSAGSQTISAVTLSGGIMTITRKQVQERVYTLRNASGEVKKLVLEHPITPGASLTEPAAFDERTARLYRFSRELPANGEFSLTVREETPVAQRITLAQLSPETFLTAAANREIPAGVRAALERAVALKREADAAQAALTELEAERTRLNAEQNRIRWNLEAAGNQSPQGQDYLRQLSALDTEIEGLNRNTVEARQKVRAAQAAYEAYLGALDL
jgi:hypothetical protein